MTRINLLPWREELRKERNRIFYIRIGITFFVSICLIIGIRVLLICWKQTEQSTIIHLKKEIKKKSEDTLEINELKTEKINVIFFCKAFRKFIFVLINTTYQIVRYTYIQYI